MKSGNSPLVGPIRPYAGISNIENFLNNSELFLSSHGEWSSNEEFSLEDLDIAKPDIRVRVDFSSPNAISALVTTVEEMNCSLQDVSLYILLRQRSLKKISTVYTESLQDVSEKGKPIEVKIDLEGDAALTKHSHLTIELYLLLAREKAGNTPFPSAKGTWLSRKVFNLEFRNHGTFGFKWLPLTIDERRAHNLGKNSFMFTEILSSMDQKEVISECVQVYIDQDFLQKADGGIERIYADYIWRDLTTKVVATVLTETMIRLSKQNTPWSGIDQTSVLYNLIEKISSTVGFASRDRDSQEIYDSLILRPSEAHGLIESLVDFNSAARLFVSHIQ